jgi:hypothetical protein
MQSSKQRYKEIIMTRRKKNTFHTVTCFIILAVFSFSITSSTLAAAKSSESLETNLSLPAQVQEKDGLSTPELIEQAFVNGEITAEQSVLSISLSTLFRAQKRLPQFPLNRQAHLQPRHILQRTLKR